MNEQKEKYVTEQVFLQQIMASASNNRRAFSIALKSLYIGIIGLIIEFIIIVYLIVSNV